MNPSLRLSVVPAPRDAPLEPSAPCTPIASRRPPPACWFGVPRRDATAGVALVGDSHAVHWRAALAFAAKARRWHGVSLHYSQCPYTAAGTLLPEPAGSECLAWRGHVRAWLGRHPEVGTVVVSHNTGARVPVAPGQDPFAARADGFAAAWRELPASVTRVIVIRDVPHVRASTPACVERAVARRRPPGSACAIDRSEALAPDPAVTAVASAADPRVRLVDLSEHMCSARRCYPVVGGVLVNRDMGHLTRTFSSTLGPFLLRAIDPLVAP